MKVFRHSMVWSAAGHKNWAALTLSIVVIAVGIFFIYERYEPPNEPTDPAGIEAKKFAHSIKLPDSVPLASYYPWWLGSEAYFKYLCEHEAGEFIFKTVNSVEGLYQMRPRERATDTQLQDPFLMEDPWGYILAEGDEVPYQFVNAPSENYKFFETTLPPTKALYKFQGATKSNGKYWRYSGFEQRRSPFQAEADNELRSQYGYIWRGIRRPHDRIKGIAGGELIILDLHTQEVLGVRRGFVRSGQIRNNQTGINWLNAKVCQMPTARDGRRDQSSFIYLFISKVLVPININADDVGVRYANKR